MEHLPIWDLSGSPLQLGHAQGALARPSYAAMLETFFGSELWKMAKPFGVPNVVLRQLLTSLGHVYTKAALRRYVPAQYERMRGIGEALGAGRFTWALAFMEVLFTEGGKALVVPKGQQPIFEPSAGSAGGADQAGCTQINAQPRATAEQVPLMGRNYDFPRLLLDYQIVRRETPSDRRRLATTTLSQTVLAGSHQGINEKGLSISANNSRPWLKHNYDRAGVPGTLLLQEALETCSTTAEAVRFISNFPARASSNFFGIMDRAGHLVELEFTPHTARVREADDSGILAASNHAHLNLEMNPPDNALWVVPGMEGKSYMTSCRARWGVADKLLRQSAGAITVETMKAILRDHSFSGGQGSEDTICCHGSQGISLASAIFNLSTLELHVTKGTPCRSRYAVVPFRSS
jgi:Acyl-coenzyme A:6-aminopenicillanic acid acyl-transferase